MPAFKLSIAEPCHENWAGMQPTGCGAFCSSCQKEVIDFTGKSTFEIIDTFRNYSGSKCGRLTAKQLDNIYQFEFDKPAPYRWLQRGIVGAGLTLLVASTQSKSQTPANATEKVENVTTIPYSLPNIYAEKSPGDIVLQGVVVDKNNEPLLGVVVRYGLNYGTVTDFEGKFKLVIPAMEVGNTFSIAFKLIGYNYQTIALDKNNLPGPMAIVLTDDLSKTVEILIMGEISIVRVEPPIVPPSPY